MSKNKDGYVRAAHNERLRLAAESYCEMCDLAGLPRSKTIESLFFFLKISSIEEKIIAINPNRLKSPKRLFANEVRLYNLFLAYCVLDLIQIGNEGGEAGLYSEKADYCNNFIATEKERTFGELETLQQFSEFIEGEFFPLYDALIHDKMQGIVKFKDKFRQELIMLKHSLFFCPDLVDKNSLPYILEARKTPAKKVINK